MFQLHDRTRRRVCIAAFLLAGILPLLVAGAWCVNRRLPSSVAAEAQELSRRLGLEVKLGGFAHLRPGVVLYKNLEAADPETGNVVLSCEWLEVACERQADGRAENRHVLLLTASGAELDAASLDQLWRRLRGTLEGLRGPIEADLHFAASSLLLREADAGQSLDEVTGSIVERPEGVVGELAFRLAGAATPEPARVRFVRNRQMSPPESGFELSTGGGELPCSVLAMGLAELAPLGPRCRFQGRIVAAETPDGWQGEVSGQLIELDLGRLVTDNFPHRLAASAATAKIESARFRNSRLEEGRVEVLAGQGTIGRSLLDAAVNRLGLVPGESPLPPGDSVMYERLAFTATLDARGLQLRGGLEGATILDNGRTRLLGESVEQPLPMAALVQTLVPQSIVQVPASRQSDWLARHLPVPTVVPPEGAETHARARLRKTPPR